MKRLSGSRIAQSLVRLGVFLTMAALIVGMAGCNGDGGYNPPPSENLEIRTWYDLDAVRDNLAGNYTLTNDLDSTTVGYEELAGPPANGGKGWEPIGWQPIGSFDAEGFNGTFDGQGYEIRDLFINRPDQDLIGLFCGVGGHIKDLGVVNAYVVGANLTGGLAAGSGGTVSHCYFSGSVTGYTYVGGLLGSNGGPGTVSYCYFNGSVTGNIYVGCLVGFNSYAVVSNSYSTGNATGGGAVGGLVGVNERGYVSNSYSAGSADGVSCIGGLVGANAGNVSESYSIGRVTGNESVGGLIGYDSWAVTNSFWDIQTSGQATSDGGTGKNTTEMQDIATFSGAGWNIIAVALNETNLAYIWNIVNNVTYPFLSWQP